MPRYIDKSAVMAEIERRIADNKKDIERSSHKNLEDYFEGYEDALVLFKEKFLDTLEVKEVDLEKEIELVKGDYEQVDVAWNNDFDFIAKHFFELGMQQSKKDNNNEEKA